MSWVILAIGSHFFWALVNIGDKFIVDKRISNPYVYHAVLTYIGLPIAITLALIFGYELVPMEILGMQIIGGLFWFLGSIEYFKALRYEEVSRVNIWWGMIPVFSLILGWIFIGESLSVNELLAFAVLVIGTFVASIHAKKKSFSFSRGFWHMMVSTFFYAINVIIFRYVAQHVDVFLVFINSLVISFGWAACMYVSKTFRTDMLAVFRKGDKKLFATLLGIEIFDDTAKYLSVAALSLGPAALVFSLEGFQALFVFVMAICITIFAPGLFKEELDKENITLKILALVLMMSGIWMLGIA